MLTMRKKPTPTDTVTISTVVSISGVFVASTCRSGSATVIATPSTKLISRISPSFRDLVILAPIWFPICVIDSSEPRVNRAIPTIIIREPIRNESISPLSMGTKNMQRTATINVIGSTDKTDSFIFSANTL